MNVRPAAPTLSHAVNLATVLGTTEAYVGFTSGTGAAYANHDILTWVFDNSFNPIGGAAPAATADIPTMSDAALALSALLLAALGMRALGRRKRT